MDLMEFVITCVSWICFGLGSFLVIVSGVGLLRLPDYYTRIHAAGVTDTLGSGLFVVGMILQAGLDQPLVMVKLATAMLFMSLTSATAGHALAKAAWLRGIKPWTAADHDHHSH